MVGEMLASLMIDAGKNSIPASEKTDICFGKVTGVDPVKIQVENEPKLELTEDFLILSPLCKEKIFTIPEFETDDEAEHQHSITVTGTAGPYLLSATATCGTVSHKHPIPAHEDVVVWRGLEVDDVVIMLRVLGGSKFYVLQRMGELD